MRRGEARGYHVDTMRDDVNGGIGAGWCAEVNVPNLMANLTLNLSCLKV